MLEELLPPQPTLRDSAFCAGTGIVLDGGDFQKWLWSNGDTTRQTTYYEAGIDWLQVFDGACKGVDSAYLFYLESPDPKLGNRLEVCGDIDLDLDAGPGASYLWRPGLETTRVIHIKDSGMYSVAVWSSDGCVSEDEVSILRYCTGELYMPNCFTPGNDPLNNTFLARGTNITDFRMEIYDRWGQLIFISDNMNNGWDGNIRGLAAEAGVYAWRLTYNGGSARSGNVTLLR
jgi:gliding motility-associated-like protein